MVQRRFLAGIFLALFAVLAVVSAAFFWETRRELQRHREVEAANRLVLERKEAELRAQEERLERLRTDPAYVEKAIREGMNYVRPGETVYRFESVP